MKFVLFLVETFMEFSGSAMSEDSDVMKSLENVLLGLEEHSILTKKQKMGVIPAARALIREALFF